MSHPQNLDLSDKLLNKMIESFLKKKPDINFKDGPLLKEFFTYQIETFKREEVIKKGKVYQSPPINAFKVDFENHFMKLKDSDIKHHYIQFIARKIYMKTKNDFGDRWSQKVDDALRVIIKEKVEQFFTKNDESIIHETLQHPELLVQKIEEIISRQNSTGQQHNNPNNALIHHNTHNHAQPQNQSQQPQPPQQQQPQQQLGGAGNVNNITISIYPNTQGVQPDNSYNDCLNFERTGQNPQRPPQNQVYRPTNNDTAPIKQTNNNQKTAAQHQQEALRAQQIQQQQQDAIRAQQIQQQQQEALKRDQELKALQLSQQNSQPPIIERPPEMPKKQTGKKQQQHAQQPPAQVYQPTLETQFQQPPIQQQQPPQQVQQPIQQQQQQLSIKDLIGEAGLLANPKDKVSEELRDQVLQLKKGLIKLGYDNQQRGTLLNQLEHFGLYLKDPQPINQITFTHQFGEDDVIFLTIRHTDKIYQRQFGKLFVRISPQPQGEVLSFKIIDCKQLVELEKTESSRFVESHQLKDVILIWKKFQLKDFDN